MYAYMWITHFYTHTPTHGQGEMAETAEMAEMAETVEMLSESICHILLDPTHMPTYYTVPPNGHHCK